jgi:hypothetical protein
MTTAPFRLTPRKVVFHVPQQEQLAPEAVVVDRLTLIHSSMGSDEMTAQRFVEVLLQSPVATEQLARQATSEHKFFTLEFRLTEAPLKESCYLKHLETQLLRPIERVSIVGPFELTEGELGQDGLRPGKVVWVTGKRRKEKISFGVWDAESGLHSSPWVCVTERGRARSDVYLVPSAIDRVFKVSLHQSGSWQFGFIREYANGRHEPKLRNGRHWEIWERPKELIPGLTRAFAVVIPGAAARLSEARGENVIWVPAPSLNEAIEFNILLASPDVLANDSWPGKNKGMDLAGHFELENGEILCVIHRKIDKPKPEPVAIPSEIVENLLNNPASAKLTLSLVGRNNEDGSRFIYEVPLDLEGLQARAGRIIRKLD